MSKYLIEFEDKHSCTEEGHKFYRCKQATWWSVSDSIINQLKPFDEDLAENETYGKGFNEGFNKGLVAAWECAKYLFSEMSDTEINLVFPQEWNNGGFKALMALHPQDAIDRIKTYEEQRKADAEIKVGDEVRSNNAISDHKGVVLMLSDNRNSAKVLESDGTTAWVASQVLEKTGRHFTQVEELLKAMKGGTE